MQAPATESPQGGHSALLRVSPMAQSLHLHEQAERCRRLTRDSADVNLRGRLLELADDYAARAAAMEDREPPIRNAGSDEPGLA